MSGPHIVLHSSVSIEELRRAVRGSGITIEHIKQFDALVIRQPPQTFPVADDGATPMLLRPQAG